MPKQKTIEIARSYSRKLDIGNYQNIDIFCSAKSEVGENEREKTSEELYNFCKSEVEKSVAEYLEEKRMAGVKLWENKKEELYGAKSPQELYNEKSELDDTLKEVKEIDNNLPIIPNKENE